MNAVPAEMVMFGSLKAVVCGVLVLGGAAAVWGGGMPGGVVPATQPNTSIKQVMTRAFEGNTSLLAKVTGGTATDAEKKLLLDYCKALAARRAPQNKTADWAERTSAILKAAQGVVDGEKDATDALAKATHCQTCHAAYGVRG
jgi:cytochrome c553